nr:hypothetical protein [Armatimonas sp.]
MDIDAIRARVQATRDVQAVIAQEWTWQEKSVAQWDTDLAQLTQHEQAESATEQAEHDIRTQRNDAYKALERRTMQSVALLKVSARSNAAHTELLGKLPGTPKGRPQVLARAQAVSDAWKQIAPSFAPTPELTQPKLEAAIAACRTLEAQTSAGKVAWREAAESLAEFAAEQDADSKAWYALATRLFAAGTATGELIRGRIPTDYRSKP